MEDFIGRFDLHGICVNDYADREKLVSILAHNGYFVRAFKRKNNVGEEENWVEYFNEMEE